MLVNFQVLKISAEVIKVIKQTGMLEFVDVGDSLIAPGTEIQTDYQVGAQTNTEVASPTPAPLNVGQPEVTSPHKMKRQTYSTLLLPEQTSRQWL